MSAKLNLDFYTVVEACQKLQEMGKIEEVPSDTKKTK